MRPPELTPSQLGAVAHGAGDACVVAGAGSGKTTVLTERYVALARPADADVRRIAALTFTERAAAEMRERIARRFAQDPVLRAKARDVEFAPISTIHAFCARLLREHAIEAGLDPSFDLLDEASARLLRDDVWATVERRLRAAGDPRLGVLARLGTEGAWRDLLTLHERRRSLAVDSAEGGLVRGASDLTTALADLRRALASMDEAIDAFRPDAAQRAAYDATRRALPPPEALARPTDEAVRLAARFAKPPSEGALLALPRGKGSQPLSAARRAVKEAFGAIAGALLDDIAAKEVAVPIRGLLAEHDAALLAAKHARGALDFADLELHALRLLDGLARRRRPLPGAPRALLVDEFQDVNPVQARILARLATAGRGERASLFGVGDPKQSIYRFRGADVAGIERLHEAAGPAGRHALGDSFRSRPELVAFHNALFGSVFPGDGTPGRGTIPYAPLVARSAFHDADVPIPVEFAVVVAPPEAGVARIDAEAELVAETVAGWIAHGRVTRKERGDPTPPSRPVGPGDVAILLRRRTNLPAFEAALAARGIPFHTGRGRGFHDVPEVRDLLHLLRVVHDPRDGFALASFLASPAVGATDEDLLAVFGSRPADPFAAAVARPSCRDATEGIEALRRVAAGGRLEDLLRAAIVRFDALPTAILQDGGSRRAKNLEKLVGIARRLEEEGGHGLDGFLRHLSDLSEREIDEPEAAAGAPDDAVALLTVHAAKGLEWPCVVVADAGAKGGAGRTPAFHVDAHGGVAWRIRDPLEGVMRASGGWDALAAAEADAADREAERLLYVALTRAGERLLVTASASARNGDGRPSRLAGWGTRLFDEFGAESEEGVHDGTLGGAPIRLRIVERRPAEPGAPVAPSPVSPRRDAADAALTVEALAAARARIASAPGTLRRTPFVVTISDLVLFASSPARYYDERVVGSEPVVSARLPRAERDDVVPAADDPLALAADAVEPRHDEGRETLDGLDRAALGRAVHLAIERWAPGGDVDALVRACVDEELPSDARGRAGPAARAMVARFLGSSAGRATDEALRAGADVRREAAFHARIRFPDEAEVGPFRSLLVKGTVDLWLPDADGRVRILDHKTNSPRGAAGTVDALVARYATQLRLYALAAERVTGRDVAGAALLLLDPEWDGRGAPVEVPIDVSGAELRRTRELCLAFARSALEDRYPARWEELLR